MGLWILVIGNNGLQLLVSFFSANLTSWYVKRNRENRKIEGKAEESGKKG